MKSNKKITNIAILASGDGSNAENLFKYFKNHKQIKPSLLITNKKNAKVVKKAEKYNIKYSIIETHEWKNADNILSLLKDYDIDFIVLAGFLILVPDWLIKKYTKKIINIHPALLPEFGGKGMYGIKVHEAVIDNNKSISGITIHYVNEKYDEGGIIFQAKCNVPKSNSPFELSKIIKKLEHKFYPIVIECLLTNRIK